MKACHVIWGIPEKVKMIDGLPKSAKVKLRFRPHTHGKAFIRIGKETKVHYIFVDNGQWVLGHLVGVNNEV